MPMRASQSTTASSVVRIAPTILQGAGVSLRSQHFNSLLQGEQAVSWLEVLADQYLNSHGILLEKLQALSALYPTSLHCVAFSLGSVEPLNPTYLKTIYQLSEQLRSVCVSDHLCWSTYQDQHSHDLLPLPYTKALHLHISDKIKKIQDTLGKVFLIENISHYTAISQCVQHETWMLNNLCESTGCGILLDINNVYVSAKNLGFCPRQYVDAIHPDFIQQYHLAGYTPTTHRLVDTHGARVKSKVWDLFAYALQRSGAKPACIEWDTDIPAWPVLADEISKAQAYLDKASVLTQQRAGVSMLQPAAIKGKQLAEDQEMLQHIQSRENTLTSIAEYQKKFWQVLHGATQLPQALPASVHQQSIRVQRIEALKQVYPCCAKLMGVASFVTCATQYTLTNHSFSADITQDFAAFYRELPDTPGYLQCLARYEYAWHQTFHARNHPPVDLTELERQVEKLRDRLCLACVDDLILLAVNYPILAVWEYCQPEYRGELVPMLAEDCYYALHQRQGLVITLRLNAAQYQSLQQLQAIPALSLTAWSELSAEIKGFRPEYIAYFYQNGLIVTTARG